MNNKIQKTWDVTVQTATVSWIVLKGTYRLMTKKSFMGFAFVVFTLAFLNAFFESNRLRTPVIVTFQNPVEARDINYISPIGGIEASAEVSQAVLAVEDMENLPTYIGKASFYSEDGCLGCKPYYDEDGEVYYITANGDRFNDREMTLAVPAEWVASGKVSLNSVVIVTNLDNGKRVLGARITDTGGFAKYGRIADLSKALAEEIELKTDGSTIKIEVLPVM